jgi:NAD(P)-dependent dehydrogenase (short-subunit alcohol dehydrogenase family)
MDEPDDIARALVWLAPDTATFVAVAEIVVDGSRTAR